jgi:hypothetical protein
MTVFDYIKQEETAYQTQEVQITDQWKWNMFKHIERSTNMLNSIFWKGSNDDFERPYMQIVLEPMNLQKALLDYDVKDVEIYAKGKHYGKSYAIRKRHEDWAAEVGLEDFFDDIVDSFTDYGGALVKKTKRDGKMTVEVVPLQRLAFCDQTDIMGGPKCEKHQFSPDQLREFDGTWENIDEAIALSSQFKTDEHGTPNSKTPGRYIEVYELHGMLPESFLDENGDPQKFSRQMHIVTYYKDENGQDKGLTLFAGPEAEECYDFVARDDVYGRALGRGGIEEIYHPQIWANWGEAQVKSILEMAGKMLFQTADQNLSATNVIKQMKSGQVIKHATDKPLSQLSNNPENMVAFENAITKWDERAKRISAAYDTVSGANPQPGMPFQLGALLSQQGQGTHKKRRKILGKFTRRLYRNWFIPQLLKEMQEPKIIRATLSSEELQRILEEEAHTKATDEAKDYMLGDMAKPGSPVLSPLQFDGLKQKHRRKVHENAVQIEYTDAFAKEMKDVEADADVTITGENKNLPALVAQRSSVFMAVAQNPAILQDKALRSLFNEMLEYAGLSPIDIDMPDQPAQGTPTLPSSTKPPLTALAA